MRTLRLGSSQAQFDQPTATAEGFYSTSLRPVGIDTAASLKQA